MLVSERDRKGDGGSEVGGMVVEGRVGEVCGVRVSGVEGGRDGG